MSPDGPMTIRCRLSRHFATAANRLRRKSNHLSRRKLLAHRCAIHAGSRAAKISPTRRRLANFSKNISCPCKSRASVRMLDLSPAITSRWSKVHAQGAISFRCRCIAARRIFSCAAFRRPVPVYPTRAMCFARSAAANWCRITTAPKSKMAQSPAAALKLCG